MQVHRVGYGVRGFGRITEYAIRSLRMVTTKAQHKARVLAFWAKHGTETTTEAFRVSKRSLFRWKGKLREGQGALEALNEKPKRPKTVRKRSWPADVVSEIRRLRTLHPNLGRDKLAPFLRRFCVRERLRNY